MCHHAICDHAVWQEKYLGYLKIIRSLVLDRHFSLSAAVCTELTDVENEVNGFPGKLPGSQPLLQSSHSLLSMQCLLRLFLVADI